MQPTQPSTPGRRAAGVWLCFAAAASRPLSSARSHALLLASSLVRRRLEAARGRATVVPALHHLGDLRPLVAVQLMALEENVVFLLSAHSEGRPHQPHRGKPSKQPTNLTHATMRHPGESPPVIRNQLGPKPSCGVSRTSGLQLPFLTVAFK